MLWEALAGWHPFWAPSLTATAKKIKVGAPPLDSARRDLPPKLLATVDRALERNPAERPSAAELAERLRRAAESRGRRQPQPRPAVPGPAVLHRVLPRALPALLAGLVTGWWAATFAFFPTGWAIGLALAAFGLTMLQERAGLALALAVPVLPLGNLSRGLAIVYGAVALVWLAIHWRRPRWGLLFTLGPLLAPVHLLGALPLLTQPVRRRRTACASGRHGPARCRVRRRRRRLAAAVPRRPPRSSSRARRGRATRRRRRHPAPRALGPAVAAPGRRPARCRRSPAPLARRRGRARARRAHRRRRRGCDPDRTGRRGDPARRVLLGHVHRPGDRGPAGRSSSSTPASCPPKRTSRAPTAC